MKEEDRTESSGTKEQAAPPTVQVPPPNQDKVLEETPVSVEALKVEVAEEDFDIPSIAGVPVPLAQLEQEAASRERSLQAGGLPVTDTTAARQAMIRDTARGNTDPSNTLPPRDPSLAEASVAVAAQVPVTHPLPPQASLPVPPLTGTTITNTSAADPRIVCPMQLVKPFDASTNLSQKIQTYRSVSAQHDVLSKTLYPPIPKSQVTDRDVLFGRGGGTNRHKGNMYFRDLVSESQPRYLQARKLEKTAISKKIIAHIRARQGRFLKWNPRTNLWEDVGDRKAVEKASQALREGLAGRMRNVTVVKDALAAKGGNVTGEPVVEGTIVHAKPNEVALGVVTAASVSASAVPLLPPPLQSGTGGTNGTNQIITIPTSSSTTTATTNNPMVATPLEGALPPPSLPPPEESAPNEKDDSRPMAPTSEEPTEPDAKRLKLTTVTV